MLDREFFLGFIKIHILYHASEAPISGVEIMEELSRHGYHMSPGTLYPTLHRLEEQGYMEQSSSVVGGRVRKYYAITGLGIKALALARQQIKELVAEVIEEQEAGEKSGKKAI